MDADRRRKTVITGTFAIRRKSLSNAQPISADRSQCTKGRDDHGVVASANASRSPRRMDLRARSLKTFSSLGRKDPHARPHTREIEAAGGVDPGRSPAEGREGKSVDRQRRSPSYRAISHFFLSKTSPIFVEAVKSPNPEARK